MDIAKYIGLFLLKNNFCYIHGLGNLVLKKKPAQYEGGNLLAPQYDVVLTPGGSIDDNLANFIANHEQTSISKAANALRDFSIESRTKLAAGEQIVLPGVGKFQENNGVISFNADPQIQYTPPPIPILRTAPQAEKKPAVAASMEATTPSYRPTDREAVPVDMASPAVNWSKIALLAFVLIALGVGGYFLYQYLQKNNETTETTNAPVRTDDSLAATTPIPTPAIDSANRVTAPAAQPAAATGPAMVVIKDYPTLVAAQRKLDLFKKEGKDVSMVSQDSTHHLILLTMPAGVTDTTRFVDSVGKFFGMKDARVFRQ